MTILSREQIDEWEYLNVGEVTTKPSDLWDTARAYHDLRDAVLGLCDEWEGPASHDPWYWSDATDPLRAAVARVDGSGNGAGSVADGAP